MNWIRRDVLRLAIFCAIALAAWQAAAQEPRPSSLPSGRSLLLVANKGENTLAVVDPETRQVLGRAPTGVRPHSVAASDDGRLAFVANYGSDSGYGAVGSISVIDLETHRELRRVDIGPNSRPHGVMFAGGKVYFTADGYKLIGCYDPAGDRMEWMLGIGQDRAETIVLSKDQNLIFSSNNASESVTIMERSSNPSNPSDWKLTVLHVGDQPQGIDLSPDGREVWVSNEGDDIVSVIDVAARRVGDMFRVQTESSSRLKFTPDGRRVVLTDRDRGQLVVLDAATRTVIRRIPGLGNRVTDVLVTPDGKWAYASAQNDHGVAVVDLEKMEFAGQIATGADPEGVAWAEVR